ncbi:hypothetical protein HK102_004517 [Quaeritorhiza haematococci]|nr:hypothetical protein HK102_004517 [Quaeritorhiza haematococci]
MNSAVVNVAGIPGGSFVEFTPLSTVSKIMDVNFMGIVRTTTLFMPLLRRYASIFSPKKNVAPRLVSVTSLFGTFACPQSSAYVASKHAGNGFLSSLRREVTSRFGVRIVIVQPGGVRTPLWSKVHADMRKCPEGVSEEVISAYGGMERALDDAERVRRVMDKAVMLSPESAAEAIVRDGIEKEDPREFLPLGLDAKAIMFFNKWLPVRVFDKLVERLQSF